MLRHMQAKIKINFVVGDLDGHTMGLTVLANKQIIFKQDTNLDKIFTVEFNIDIPGKVEFIVNGKGPLDTKVDIEGNILQDKFLKIESMSIDRMPVPKWTLESKLVEFAHNNQINYTNYFGYNGQGTIWVPSSIFSMFLGLHTAS